MMSLVIIGLLVLAIAVGVVAYFAGTRRTAGGGSPDGSGAEPRLEEFGDNFLVDLDIGTANLPTGARLRLGEAELEVTSEPHLGCAKFARRFGHAALRIVNRKELVPLKLRGIHARVLKPGRVWLGAPIAKLAAD